MTQKPWLVIAGDENSPRYIAIRMSGKLANVFVDGKEPLYGSLSSNQNVSSPVRGALF